MKTRLDDVSVMYPSEVLEENWPMFIRVWRRAHKLRQQDVAKLFKTSPTSVCSWEHGRRIPPFYARYGVVRFMQDYDTAMLTEKETQERHAYQPAQTV